MDNTSMGNRVKEIREMLNLSQESFGSKIGVTRASISNIEKCTRNMSEQTMTSICREFNVNYFWLRDGVGDMFTGLPESLFEEVAEEYDLDDLDKQIVKKYMSLNPEKRKIVKEFLKSFIEE